MNSMSWTLQRAAQSPFSGNIERAPMPSRFTRPLFNSYDGKTDPVEHVGHYIQMMSLHIHNDALMCKVFPSSLEPIALRWFNRSRKWSIHNFAELIQEFGVWFMTCSQVPQLVDALLSINMGVEETLTATLASTRSFKIRSVGATKKSRQVPFDWNCLRIPNCESHWQRGLPRIWGNWWGILKNTSG